MARGRLGCLMLHESVRLLMYAEYGAGLAKINRGAIASGKETNMI